MKKISLTSILAAVTGFYLGFQFLKQIESFDIRLTDVEKQLKEDKDADDDYDDFDDEFEDSFEKEEYDCLGGKESVVKGK